MNHKLAVFAALEGGVILVLLLLLGRADRVEPARGSGAIVPALDHETRADLGPAVDATPAARKSAQATPAKRNLASTPADGDASLTTLLYGRIADAKGKAIDDASIYLRKKGERRGVAAGVHKGKGYALPGLDRGTWSLTSRATGFKRRHITLEITGAPMQRFDVTLERAREVRVAFVDEHGKPAAAAWGKAKLYVDVSVLATERIPPDSFPMTTLRSVSRLGVGHWSARRRKDLPARFAGVLDVDVPGPVWVSAVLRQVVVAKAFVQPDQTDVDLEIPVATLRAQLATVTLRVVATESQKPIAKARVSFSDRQSGGGGQRTDESGQVTIANITPGILEFEIYAPNRERFQRLLRILPGSKLDLGSVGVDPATTIEGIVRDPAGKVVSGVQFRWFRLDRFAADVPLDNGFGASSDAEGKFKLWGTGRGRYLIGARHESGVAKVVADTKAGTIKDLQIRLVRGVKVTLVNRLKKTQMFLVRITDQSGQLVSSWLERPLPTMPERPFRLPRGRYSVEIRDDKGVVRTFPLDARQSGAKLAIPR